jgi:hypothetical protein
MTGSSRREPLGTGTRFDPARWVENPHRGVGESAPSLISGRLGATRPTDWTGVSGRAGSWATELTSEVGEPSNPASRGGLLIGGPASAPPPGGGAMFRVSHRGEGIDDADTLEGARGVVRGQSAGR